MKSSNLSSISLLSSLAKQGLSYKENGKQNEDINKYLFEIQNAAKSSTESIREIVWFINPASDQMSSLITKMKETANIMLSNIKFELNCMELKADEKINPEIRRNLYLIYKESLNNLVKHSAAAFVKILAENIEGVFRLVIEDNGIGFIVNDVKSGNGLKNLQYRARQINGDLKIESFPGKGTKVELKVRIDQTVSSTGK
jgi:signal transduction histidine kinase